MCCAFLRIADKLERRNSDEVDLLANPVMRWHYRQVNIDQVDLLAIPGMR